MRECIHLVNSVIDKIVMILYEAKDLEEARKRVMELKTAIAESVSVKIDEEIAHLF